MAACFNSKGGVPSVCISIFSALVLHMTCAFVVQNFLPAPLIQLLFLIAGVFLIWFVLSRLCKRLLRIPYSPPSFVFFNVILMCLFYNFYLLNVLGSAMDIFLNLQCFSLLIGLWRIMMSDPGYLTHSNPTVKKIDQGVLSVTETNQSDRNNFDSNVVANTSVEIGQKKYPGSDLRRLLMRVGHCKICKAFVKRFDHHCPAFGSCIGCGNHRLFILLLILFICSELCYFACGFSSYLDGGDYKDFKSGLNVNLQGFSSIPWKVSTSLFAFLQILWQIPFLLWHLYGIVKNITTDEWENWERYPDLQLLPSTNTDIHIKRFMNPYDKGMISNIVDFFRV